MSCSLTKQELALRSTHPEARDADGVIHSRICRAESGLRAFPVNLVDNSPTWDLRSVRLCLRAGGLQTSQRELLRFLEGNLGLQE